MKIKSVIIAYTVDLDEAGIVKFSYSGLPIEEIPEPERTKVTALIKMFQMPMDDSLK